MERTSGHCSAIHGNAFEKLIPLRPVQRPADWCVNELIIPNYKQTWGNIQKIADAPSGTW